MHIIIIGCGRVGARLASLLSSSGHSVVVIDKNPEAFERLEPSFKGKTIEGIGFDRKGLAKHLNLDKVFFLHSFLIHENTLTLPFCGVVKNRFL